MIQVLQGLQPGEMVVTKGSLFVDQAAEADRCGAALRKVVAGLRISSCIDL